MHYKTAIAAVALLIMSCNKDDENPDVFTPAKPGTMKAKVNGEEVSTIASTTDAQTTSVVRMELSGTSDNNVMLSLVFPLISKAGTYDSIATGRYVIIPEDQSNSFQIWTAGSAKLTVTKYDTMEMKMSGSFSFLATPQSGNVGTGNKEITEGTFTDVAIRK